jgi:ribosomal protein S12 methylthiotransferase accessory factor
MQLNELIKRTGVTRVADVTGLDRIGMPVAAAMRPLSRNLSVSFGKGASYEDARLSAVMEAAELYYSERPPSPPRIATYNELQHENAIDIMRLERLETDEDLSNVPFGWVHGEAVGSGAPVLVPWQIVSMDFTVQARRAKRHLGFGATGLAAGFSEDHAILHGIYEIVERDAHNAWNQASDEDRAQSLVDMATIQSPNILALLERVKSAGLAVLLWDMTGKTGVPCYLAEIIDLTPMAPTAYAQGSAADLSCGAAIRKAMAEAIQVRLTYITGSRDDLEWSDYGHRYDCVVENRRWVAGHINGIRRVPAQIADKISCPLAIQEAARRLASVGCAEIVAVRLAGPGEPAHVVKVVVPSLHDLREIAYVAPAQAVAYQVFA